ncbi:MAG: DUF429 domain-containing protein [Rhodothermales bacterium]|nr:DUF429 domain-containing protein [Rhodothermales bacterium]
MSVIIGIDLSGPSNVSDTAAIRCETVGDKLICTGGGSGFTDRMIFDLVSSVSPDDKLVVALDAPLSYEPGGGDRERDKALRQRLTSAGLSSGTVMTPTMTRMAYLTLRGISIARLILAANPKATIVEVHPGGALVLNGVDASYVRTIKTDQSSREHIVSWLQSGKFNRIDNFAPHSDHIIAALGACLAGQGVMMQESRWLYKKEPPLHPFDLVC